MIGVIFDVDGVLLDSMPVWMHAGEYYLESKGKQPEENLGSKLFCMSMQEGAYYLKERWQLSESVEKICEEINQVVIDYYKRSIPLKAGVIDTLESLKQKNIPMVIATSSDEHIVRAAFQRLGITSYFQRIFTCTEIGVGKNAPDIFLAAAKYIRSITDADWKGNLDIYVVEDSLFAAKTAKEAEFSVIGIYDEASHHTWETLCKVADRNGREMKTELFL